MSGKCDTWYCLNIAMTVWFVIFEFHSELIKTFWIITLKMYDVYVFVLGFTVSVALSQLGV